MANIAIDDQLLEEAQRIGGELTKKATVRQALQEYIQHRKKAKIVKLFGRVDIDPRYDYKRQRGSREVSSIDTPDWSGSERSLVSEFSARATHCRMPR